MLRLLLLLVVASSSLIGGEALKLLWSDEFNDDGLPDAKKWTQEVGLLRNGEKQYYTKARPENAKLVGGNLVLTARKEEFEKAGYTSASLTTKGTYEFTYGRVEVRAKIPTGRGMWPAVWLLGANIEQAGWPTCGEIDMMENVGFDPDLLHFNIHTKAYNHIKHTNKGASFKATKPYDDFHVYAVDWRKDRIDFWYDDTKTFTYQNDGAGPDSWPYDHNHYLILNVAVGGSWGGQKGIDESIFPQQMLVDYVRVYALE